MSSVLTLIADPAARNLSQDHVGKVQDALTRAGAQVASPDWLAPGVACDLPFTGLPHEAAEASARRGLGPAPLDLAAQASAGRRKKLLLADMESTIIGQELLDELADHAGLGPGIAKVTARAMAGELDFEAALEARVRLLAGLPATVLDEVSARITLNPGAAALVATMKDHGAHCALVSGGFDCFTLRVRDACGFHEDRANRLVVQGDRLTGAVAKPVLGPQAKRASLIELCARLALDPTAACCVGDGANDLEMVQAAGLGVAYRGKAVLRAGARFRVDHGDLTALLYLQGYRAEEITQPGAI